MHEHFCQCREPNPCGKVSPASRTSNSSCRRGCCIFSTCSSRTWECPSLQCGLFEKCHRLPALEGNPEAEARVHTANTRSIAEAMGALLDTTSTGYRQAARQLARLSPTALSRTMPMTIVVAPRYCSTWYCLRSRSTWRQQQML